MPGYVVKHADASDAVAYASLSRQQCSMGPSLDGNQQEYPLLLNLTKIYSSA